MKNLKKASFQTLQVIALIMALIAVSAVLVPAADNGAPLSMQLTVRFAPSPGTLSDYDNDVYSGVLGFRINSFPEPIPPLGYVFVGWFVNGTQVHPPIAAVRSITILAAFAPVADPESTVSFAIVYDPGPGQLPAGVSPIQSFTYGSALISLPIPSKTGYNFTGWIWNEEPAVPPLIIRSDMVLEAAWMPASGQQPAQPLYPPTIPPFHYVAAFNPFPGTFTGDETGLRFGRSGSMIRGMPENPVRQGAIFDGWRLPNGSPLDGTLVIQRDIMLTAIWNSYTESGAASVTSVTPIERRPNPQTSPIVVSVVIFGAVIFLGLTTFGIFRLRSRQAAATGKYHAAMARYVREIRILIKNR